jgi:hypothetical protein
MNTVMGFFIFLALIFLWMELNKISIFLADINLHVLKVTKKLIIKLDRENIEAEIQQERDRRDS